MSLPHRGAEAVVTAGEWLGQRAVFKHRNPRNYRHPALERRLVAERLRAEARLLARAGEAGLPVPALYAVRLPDTLVMERLEGEPLERALRRRDGAAWLPRLGRLLRRLHAAGLVHGDPTTSNFIARGTGDALEAGRGGVGGAEGAADAEAGGGADGGGEAVGADGEGVGGGGRVAEAVGAAEAGAGGAAEAASAEAGADTGGAGEGGRQGTDGADGADRVTGAGASGGAGRAAEAAGAGVGDESAADPTRSGSAALYVVDLGLGAITDDDEARATDLRVMLESLEAHHPELGAREPVLAAYGARQGAAATLARLRKLERRGRYNLMRG